MLFYFSHSCCLFVCLETSSLSVVSCRFCTLVFLSLHAYRRIPRLLYGAGRGLWLTVLHLTKRPFSLNLMHGIRLVQTPRQNGSPGTALIGLRQRCADRFCFSISLVISSLMRILLCVQGGVRVARANINPAAAKKQFSDAIAFFRRRRVDDETKVPCMYDFHTSQ